MKEEENKQANVENSKVDIELILTKIEKVKSFCDDLNKKIESINKVDMRNDLANTINAASNAFEKISDQNVKNAAKGLALAAIGKLHIEIDKL